MDLMELPVVMIEHIFSFLSYDEIARNRLVSRTVNDICMRMLNRGFTMIERRHAMALKSVKAQLPRRESERRDGIITEISKATIGAIKWRRDVTAIEASEILRAVERKTGVKISYHHLSRHCDILTSIETRISMLNMTYSKFIDNGLCCFIPGKVIDEIRRVLTMVETSATPPRAHEVLQELRDISSMAIEHFDDKISPALRKRLQQGTVMPAAKPPNTVLASLALRQEMAFLRRRAVLNGKLSMYLANQYTIFHKRMMNYKKVVYRQRKIIRDLTRKQRNQDSAIADLKKRIEECDIKYSELTHTNQAVGGNAIAELAGGQLAARSAAQPLRHFSSQIKLDLSVLPIGTSKRNNKLSNMKPRKAMIKLPSLSEDDAGPPAKLQKLDESHVSPSPSSSGKLSPRTRAQCSLAKIRGITNEIRQINNLTKTLDSTLKRRNAGELYVLGSKKQKLD